MEKRMSICMAYYIYAMLWTRNGYADRYHNIYTQLERIKFRPSPLLKGPKDLDEFGLEVYRELVDYYHGVQEEYDNDDEHLEDSHLDGWLNDR